MSSVMALVMAPRISLRMEPWAGSRTEVRVRKLLDYLARPIERRGLPECATLLSVMADRTFVILKYYKDNVPSMASCAKCQRQFFTPNTFRRDPALAEQYLLEKFAQHTCPEETDEGTGGF